jgi:spoIIIJ-associated protein
MKTATEAEGATIDEAIERGLAELGADRDSVRVEIVRDARRGLLGFGSQKALVRLTRRAEVRGIEETLPSVREVEPAAQAFEGGQAMPAVPLPLPLPATSDGDGEGASGDVVAVVGELLDKMGFPAAVSLGRSAEGGVLVRIDSEGSGLLIGKHGQTLDALEYVVNRMLGRREQGEPPVALDAGGYRERRRESLERSARSLAERVRKRGRAETLAPMTPRDRRVVHLTLREDESVTTRSLGQGHIRRVVIAPARASRGGPDEPRRDR